MRIRTEARDSCILAVLTVGHPPAAVATQRNVRLIAGAVEVVQPDRSASRSERRP